MPTASFSLTCDDLISYRNKHSDNAYQRENHPFQGKYVVTQVKVKNIEKNYNGGYEINFLCGGMTFDILQKDTNPKAWNRLLKGGPNKKYKAKFIITDPMSGSIFDNTGTHFRLLN